MRNFTKSAYLLTFVITSLLLLADSLYPHTRQKNSITISLTLTNVSCEGGNDGAITIQVSGGVGDYTYEWLGPNGYTATSKNIENLTAGNYTINVKDEEGSIAERSVTLSEPDTIRIENILQKNVSCFEANDGEITINEVSGGTPPYQYSINNIDFSQTNIFKNLEAGSYIITVKDANGCTATSSEIAITEPALLTTDTPIVENVSCNGNNDGKLTAAGIDGGTPPYQYSINGSDFFDSSVFENLATGTYTLTVQDANNCRATSSEIIITEPSTLTMEAPIIGNVSCNGSNNGTVAAGEISGGTAPYEYSIDGVNFQNSPSFENIRAGNYTLTIKDANNCSTSQNFTITQPNTLYAELPTTTQVSCYGNDDGVATAGEAYGGTAPYKYSIDGINFQNSPSFENLRAGNYTLTIKDANNCNVAQNITIEQPEKITANFSKIDVQCYGETSGSISFENTRGGSGRYEYSIDGINWSSSRSFTSLDKGSYLLQVRDADNQNCIETISENVEITAPSAPLSLTSSTSRTTIFNTPTGAATINPSGGTPGYTYQWRVLGTSEIISTTKTTNNLNAGDYKVLVTDKNGCTEEITITVNEIIHAEILPTSICENNPIRISYFELLDGSAQGGVAPYTYSWNYGNHQNASSYTGAGPNRVEYSDDGNYQISLVVTDAEGFSKEFTYDQYVGECFIDNCGSNDFNLSGFFIGDENGNEISSTNCNDGSLKYIYVILDQNPKRYSLYTEFIYTVKSIKTNTTKTYRTSNCFYEKQIIPTKARTIPIEYSCGDEVTIENIYIKFSNKKNRACGQSQSPKCYSTNNNQIISTPLFATAQGNVLKCFDSELGSITVEASGGKAPYLYSKTSPNEGYQTNNTFKILKAGEYDVWVKDAENTVFEIPAVKITQPDSPINIEFNIEQPKCFGETGSVIATATGGTPFTTTEREPYTYLWNTPNNDTTKEVTNLEPGTYTLTAIDANDCQTIKSFEIISPPKLTTANAGSSISLDCGYNGTNLNGNTPQVGNGVWSVVSGPENHQFTDSTNATTKFIAEPGTYTLKWTIFNEFCANADEITIEISDPCKTIDFDGIDDHIFLGTPDFTQLQSGFTIEAWVKTLSSKNEQTIIGNKEYSLLVKDGSPAFRYQNEILTTPHQLATGKWHHVAVIFRNNSYILYADGIQLNSVEMNTFTLPNSPLLIGAVYDESTVKLATDFFRGSIQEIRLWNKDLSENQLRFLMNQPIEEQSKPLKGTVLSKPVPGELAWGNLIAYFPLSNSSISQEGKTIERTGNIEGAIIRNSHSAQENSAPLPYIMNQPNSSWNTPSSWLVPTYAYNDTITSNDVWQIPGEYGIDNENKIDWNIVEISNSITYPYIDSTSTLQVLGLLLNSTGNLTIEGNSLEGNETGSPLIVTDYLKLDGTIDLNGESQLIQPDGSYLDSLSTGSIQRDQQGTANSYNYNYWTSPVSSEKVNGGFTLTEVLKDGTNPNNIQNINFGAPYTWADSKNYQGPKRISTYWLHTFQQTVNNYYGWKKINENSHLQPGIGFSMKGTSGEVPISTKQNYTFIGLPNNGTIKLHSKPGDNFLIGNPYPSALYIERFILDNLDKNTVNGATGDKNLFNGSIYIWDHFGPRHSHYLREYVGGYATVNLIGSIPAIANNERINGTNENSSKTPGTILPIGQGFLINSSIDSSMGITISEGDIVFKNSQRLFAREYQNPESIFLRPEFVEKSSYSYTKDQRRKIRLNYTSPGGMWRQIIAGEDANTSDGFDLGYDAPLYDPQTEDMYWLLEGEKAMVIQGVPDFNAERTLNLGIIISENKEFSIEIDSLENIDNSLPIYLFNKTDSTYHDLRAEKYTATLDSGRYNNTYAIAFSKPEPQEEENEKPEKEVPEEEEETEEDIEEPSSGSLDVYYVSNENMIYIENPQLEEIDRLLIYDIKGSLIAIFDIIPTKKIVKYSMNQPKSTAPYLLKLYAGEQIINKKIIKK